MIIGIIPNTSDSFPTIREEVGHEVECKLELLVTFDDVINDAFGWPTLTVILEIEKTSELLVSVVNCKQLRV